MEFGKNENVLATFEKKHKASTFSLFAADTTKLILTNYRVSLESSGSWFKKVKGLQSITLSSVNSANLIVRHNPSYLWITVIGLLGLIAVLFGELDLPEVETLTGSVVLLVLGLILYSRSRTAGILIKSINESLSVDAPQSKNDAYDFVNKVMEHRANIS